MENNSKIIGKNQNEELTNNYNINPYLKEYSMPTGTGPNGILVDKNGTIWVVGSKINSLFRFDPVNERFQSFQIPMNSLQDNRTTNSSMVWTILQDNDGFIWFSQLGTKSVWRFNPYHYTFTSFNTGTAPFQMKLDDSGNIWFTTLTGGTVGVIQKTQNEKYQFKEFPTGNGSKPVGLFLQNNDLWVTDISNQNVIKYHIMYDGGNITNIEKTLEIPSDNKTSIGSATDIFVSNDIVWLTEHGSSFLTRYQINSQYLTRFPTSQNEFHVTTLPFWMRTVEDGKGIWFNEHEGNKIAFFNTEKQSLTEYEIPSRPQGGYLVYPLNIAVEQSDGNKLWFSEWNTDKIGVIDGTISTQFEIHSDSQKIILKNDTDQQLIKIEISKNNRTAYNDNILYLNASSSMQPTAGFEDLDVQFSINPIDLAKNNTVQLLIRNNSAPPGNYTMAVSAHDNEITKTIFFDLQVRK